LGLFQDAPTAYELWGFGMTARKVGEQGQRCKGPKKRMKKTVNGQGYLVPHTTTVARASQDRFEGPLKITGPDRK